MKRHISPIKFYIILIILACTTVTPTLAGWLLFHFSDWKYGPNPYFPLMNTLIESLLAGIFLTLMINHFLLSPIMSFIDAINQVSKGDFSVRV